MITTDERQLVSVFEGSIANRGDVLNEGKTYARASARYISNLKRSPKRDTLRASTGIYITYE